MLIYSHWMFKSIWFRQIKSETRWAEYYWTMFTLFCNTAWRMVGYILCLYVAAKWWSRAVCFVHLRLTKCVDVESYSVFAVTLLNSLYLYALAEKNETFIKCKATNILKDDDRKTLNYRQIKRNVLYKKEVFYRKHFGLIKILFRNGFCMFKLLQLYFKWNNCCNYFGFTIFFSFNWVEFFYSMKNKQIIVVSIFR